jgi:hypothetical protein
MNTSMGNGLTGVGVKVASPVLAEEPGDGKTAAVMGLVVGVFVVAHGVDVAAAGEGLAG